MSSFYTPPPPLTIIGGTTITVTQPQIYNDVNKQGNSSSSTSSIIIVIIVIASAIIVSASVYLLLRFISRRFHRSFRTFSAVDDVIPSGNSHDRREPQPDLFNLLPLFTFGSVTGKVTGGDCAVCLSKFESHDQLRLLPLCCHAFHARCIDTWLASNQTCPLCRSTVVPTDADVLNKALSASVAENGNENSHGNSNDSFRLEIGSISRRRAPSDQGQRSYSIGSFEYIVDDGYEVSVSDCTSVDKDSIGVPVNHIEPPGESLAVEVASGRSWLRDYVDRFSWSSRALSFRSSGRFFTGSSRRTEGIVVEDIEANRIGEEIGELFRWFSGV